MLSLIAVLLLGASTPATPKENADITKGSVVVAPLHGEVTEAQFLFLRRALKQAESAQAEAFIIDMNTPGGAINSTEKIVQLLSKATIPTYTWVNPNAASAGALIALATKHIYMAPISAIGAAAPVMSTGGDIPETMKAKAVSYSSAYFRSVAEQNGYDPNLVDAFMDEGKEFKIGDTVISPKDSLLTLNAQEAIKEYGGKRLLADGIVKNLDELKEKAGLTGPIVTFPPSGFERIALVITSLAPLFLLGGIIGTYLELKTPGFGVAGIIAAICFMLFFAGHHIAGLTGYETAVIFIVGLVLVLVEIFLFPGLFVFAMLGAGLMLGALLFAMVDYFPGEPLLPSSEALVIPALNLALAMALSAIVIFLISRYLPQIPVLRSVVLQQSNPAGPAIPASSHAPEVPAGATGRALTMLRPAGRVEINGEIYDATTQGEFIAAGETVRVVSNIPGSVIVEKTG